MIKCSPTGGEEVKRLKKWKSMGKYSGGRLCLFLVLSLSLSLVLSFCHKSFFASLCQALYVFFFLSKPPTLFISQTICLCLSPSLSVLFIILSMYVPSSFSLNHPPSSFPDYLSPSLSVPLYHTLYVSAFVFLSKPPTFFLPRLSVSVSLCPSLSYSVCICFRLSL